MAWRTRALMSDFGARSRIDSGMTTIEDLRRQMEAAAEAMDFELASRLRDRISLLRGQDAQAAATIGATIDPTGLTRQQPGAMGLGTSQQRMTPPDGWTPPPRPDPMTRGRSRGRGKAGR